MLGYVALGRDLVGKASLPSLAGVNLTVHRNRFFTQIDSPGNAGFVDTFDLRGGRAVMHVIDGVLLPVANVLPPSLYDILTDNGEFQTLKVRWVMWAVPLLSERVEWAGPPHLATLQLRVGAALSAGAGGPGLVTRDRGHCHGAGEPVRRHHRLCAHQLGEGRCCARWIAGSR